MCVTDRHDMMLAVKVALNTNTTFQYLFQWLCWRESRQWLGKNIVQSTYQTKLQEGIDRCSGCLQIIEMILQMVLNLYLVFQFKALPVQQQMKVRYQKYGQMEYNYLIE